MYKEICYEKKYILFLTFFLLFFLRLFFFFLTFGFYMQKVFPYKSICIFVMIKVISCLWLVVTHIDNRVLHVLFWYTVYHLAIDQLMLSLLGRSLLGLLFDSKFHGSFHIIIIIIMYFYAKIAIQFHTEVLEDNIVLSEQLLEISRISLWKFFFFPFPSLIRHISVDKKTPLFLLFFFPFFFIKFFL